MNPPIIVCAAIKFEDVIITGPRHYDKTMNNQLRNSSAAIRNLHKFAKMGSGVTQGFVDQFGKFYDRIEAMAIVMHNGQPFDIERNGGSNKLLYSEGLY